MAKAKTVTRYAIVLRTQFIPEGATTGPYRDIHYKILPSGSASLSTAGILGFPVLDCPPYGLGWRVCPTAHVFSALDVALPRLEMQARERYFAALAAERAPGAEAESDVPYADDGDFFDYENVLEEGETVLQLAEETYGSTCTANALLAVDTLLLSPGDQAFVPVRFDRAVPKEDFWVASLPDKLKIVHAVPGPMDGGKIEQSLALDNSSVVDVAVGGADGGPAGSRTGL